MIFGGLLIVLIVDYFEVERKWALWIQSPAWITMIFGLGLLKAKLNEQEVKEAPPEYFDEPVCEKRWEKILHYGSAVLFIVGFLLTVSTIFWAKHLVAKNTTLGWGAGFGLLLVFLIWLILKGKYAFVFTNNAIRKKELLIGAIGLVMNSMILMAAFVIFLETAKSLEVNVPVLAQGKNESMGFDYLKIAWADEEFTFILSEDEVSEYSGKDSVNIYVHESVFGFEHIIID